MSKKCEFDGRQAYRQSEHLLVAKDDDGMWGVIHEPSSKWWRDEEDGRFKQKREAVELASDLLSRGYNFDFKNEKEFWEKNG